MYEVGDIAKAVKRTPFRPIRLHLSSGEVIELSHPDAVILTDYSIVVGRGQGTVEGAVADYEVIGLDHIVKVDPAAV